VNGEEYEMILEFPADKN